MDKSALASLTAQYTDSENEEEHSPESESSRGSVSIPQPKTPPNTSPLPAKVNEPSPTVASKRKKRKRVLVSYLDDTLISDEEDDDHMGSSGETSDSESEESPPHNGSGTNGATTSQTHSPVEPIDDALAATYVDQATINAIENSNKYTHYKCTLPPNPQGKPLLELNEKIEQMYGRMNEKNMDMNSLIQNRKEFRNPSIYEKLIQFCGIYEFGTNYPPEIYNPDCWGEESKYEELARAQKSEMLKRQKQRKETDKVEHATALARKVEEEAKKRKSKWDQPAPTTKSVQPLTTTVTGTKGTVISAFGTLPKKNVN